MMRAGNLHRRLRPMNEYNSAVPLGEHEACLCTLCPCVRRLVLCFIEI